MTVSGSRGGDFGCTEIRLLLMLLNCALTNVTMVSFLLLDEINMYYMCSISA